MKVRRPRPHIPLGTKLSVAERQLGRTWEIRGQTRTEKLRLMLKLLFDGKPAHLDHDPPLRARAFNSRTGKYSPNANDPNYLIYREKEEHRVKTFVRGEHGQYSDTILIARERKREKKRAGKRRKYLWPKRKIQNRGFPCFRQKKSRSISSASYKENS